MMEDPWPDRESKSCTLEKRSSSLDEHSLSRDAIKLQGSFIVTQSPFQRILWQEAKAQGPRMSCVCRAATLLMPSVSHTDVGQVGCCVDNLIGRKLRIASIYVDLCVTLHGTLFGCTISETALG